MKYDVLVLVPSAAIGGKMRTMATRTTPARTLREVRSWAATNRETWRDALNDDESRFLVLALEEHTRPVLAIEHTREWGTNGVEYGRDTLRSMLTAIQDDKQEMKGAAE